MILWPLNLIHILSNQAPVSKHKKQHPLPIKRMEIFHSAVFVSSEYFAYACLLSILKSISHHLQNK